MPEEKNNKNRKNEEECPLCRVSEETIKRLKEKGKRKEELENELPRRHNKNNKK